MNKCRFTYIFLFFCVSVLFLGHSPIASAEVEDSSSDFILTKDERAYLNTISRPITIAYSYDLVAARFDGVSCAMLDPILFILREEFGLTVNLQKLNWHDAFLNIENGKADFYGPIAISEARRERYITVDPFYRSFSKIVSRIDHPINSMLGLTGLSIGLLEGSVISRTMQAYLGAGGQIKYFPSMDDMITGLSTGVIDAFATVDNAEFEIMRQDGMQFEFSIENFYVDQGLISGREDMRGLAALLNRYLKENPEVNDGILKLRNQALIKNSQELYAGEIAYLQNEYSEITIYSDTTLYPLCYMENGTIKGMQIEINDIFEELTGIGIRFATESDYPRGMASAVEKLILNECMSIVGVNFNIDKWNDPMFEYSPLLWLDTINTYSYKDSGDNLTGKTLGTTIFNTDYLGWNNTTGNAPVIYNNNLDLVNALKRREMDVIFMGAMQYNYGYTVLSDYSLREVMGLSADVPMHMLYASRNAEFNALFNEALVLFHILSPKSMGQWKTQSDKYKSDYIRMRYSQQILNTIVIVVFAIMLTALFIMLQRNRRAHKITADAFEVVKQKNEIITSSIDYASKIQKNLLPADGEFMKAFSDYAIIWKPRDVVGGDIYWLKRFDAGTVLCVCDCTGHGTPGAFLTMLVASALEVIVDDNTCGDTAEIIWMLEQRLTEVLHVRASKKTKGSIREIEDGCDIAVLFIATGGEIKISSGHIHVFICDGKEVKQIKGQNLYIGEGKIKSKDEIKTTITPPNPDSKYYIASDGLYSQKGGENGIPYGYKEFKHLLLENHNEKQEIISDRIWRAFEVYRGESARLDDFELITFKP